MNEAAIEKLVAKQDILECFLRNRRGIDRMDREMVLSTYHDDGLDVHCSIWGKKIIPGEDREYRGVPEDFVAWLFANNAQKTMTQSRLTNHLCEVDGDIAHAESYIMQTSCSDDGTLVISSARYIDRFDRRNGEWRIAVRYAFPEWSVESPVKVSQLKDMDFPWVLGKPSRDRSDPSYLRPLPCPKPGP